MPVYTATGVFTDKCSPSFWMILEKEQKLDVCHLSDDPPVFSFHRNENPSVLQLHFILISLELNRCFSGIFGLLTFCVPTNKRRGAKEKWILKWALWMCGFKWLMRTSWDVPSSWHNAASAPSVTQPFLRIVLLTNQWDEKALKLIGHSDGTVGMCLKFLHWYFHTLADSVERSASDQGQRPTGCIRLRLWFKLQQWEVD